MESHKVIFHRLFLFLLGFTALATQVILIREAMAVFQGNELIIGLFMGIWMVLTAIGAFLAAKGLRVMGCGLRVTASRFQVPGSGVQRLSVPGFLTRFFHRKSSIVNRKSSILSSFLLSILSLSSLLSLFLLIKLRFIIIPAGIMAGLGQTLLVISISLIPFCLVSGMAFPILTKELSSLKGKNLIYQGYALDSAGSILGGLLFSLVFLFILSSVQSLIIIALLNLAVITVWFWKSKKWIAVIILAGISIAIIIFYLTIDVEKKLANVQYSGQKLIETTSSPYGKLAVTQSGIEKYFYENGVPVAPAKDVINNEESVHYAMLLHKNPISVLLISGGSPGVVDEILKYPVSRIDYVEPDPWLVDLVDKYRKFPEDQKIRYIHKDPRVFLHNENDIFYDVILINTPEPNSASANRFYTVEFFKLLKDKMNADGILSVPVTAAGDYMSESSGLAHSVMYNSLKDVFTNVIVIPGYRDYFLASSHSLDHSIFRNYDFLNISNEYVNPFYVDEQLTRMRSDQIMKDLSPGAPLNSNLKPFVFLVYLNRWLDQFKTIKWIIPAILVILIVIVFIFLGPLNLGLFAGGFTASSMEFILLIWLQVMYGLVYQMSGVVFAVFMAGLTIGSLFYKKIFRRPTFGGGLKIQGFIALFSLLVAGLIAFIPSGSPGPVMISLILFLVLGCGIITGVQFSVSANLRMTGITVSAGESFSSDLAGSAIGILLISVYIIPMIGLPMTGVVLAVLNLVALGVVALKGR